MTPTAERDSICLLISLLREKQEIDEMLGLAESFNLQSKDSKDMVSNGLSAMNSIDDKVDLLKNSLGYPSFVSLSESQLQSRLSRLS